MENITLNSSEILQALATLPGFANLIRVLQTAGIIIIIYVIFLLIKNVLQYQKLTKIANIARTIERIEESISRIENKIPSSAKQKSRR